METMTGFQKFFMFMGPWKWPLLLITVIILILIGIKIFEFAIRKKPIKKYINAILFWGGIAALVGLAGQFNAIWNLLNEMLEAADLSAPMIWMGFLSSFAATQFGLGILLISAICWWALRNIYFALADKSK